MNKQKTLWIVFGITTLFMLVEFVVAIITNSLALLADSIHMLTDAGALAIAAFAAWMAEKPATPKRTYGYFRVEILAALTNSIILTGSALFIIYEAYQRFREPREITALPVIITAVLGLIVNLVGFFIMRESSKKDLNMQGAFYEVIKDALGSVAVIVAAGVVILTGFEMIDPIASVLIALFILPRTWNLLKQSVGILLEEVPAHINLTNVKETIESIEHIEAVHDLHVWTISSDLIALSGHVLVKEETNKEQAKGLLTQINQVLREEFDIEHTTIQIEFEDIQQGEPEV